MTKHEIIEGLSKDIDQVVTELRREILEEYRAEIKSSLRQLVQMKLADLGLLNEFASNEGSLLLEELPYKPEVSVLSHQVSTLPESELTTESKVLHNNFGSVGQEA